MRELVLVYLQEHGTITTWEAIKELGCTRLSEYIRQLRKEYLINDEWIVGVNRWGHQVKWKEYKLIGEYRNGENKL